MEYIDQLKADRQHAAHMATVIATRILMEGKHQDHDALDTMRQWSTQRDALDQQIAWMNRRTGWAWPHEPAWTN